MNEYNRLIFELSKPSRCGVSLPDNDLPYEMDHVLPSNLLRQSDTILPEVAELDVVRHYTNLSQKNFGVESGFYPLGSCTMKYNPKINEEVVANKAFQTIHPLLSADHAQGLLQVYFETNRMLSSLTGMAEFTFQPFAGAHGELTGLMIMRDYHHARNDHKRTKVLVPDSAHGTNPASAAVVGLEAIDIKSNPDGTVNIEDLKTHLSDEIAGIMLTNPNTLGMFEKDILLITKLVHEVGGLCYYDGANLNAILGIVRPFDMGFDIMHINLHKTFSTPHGGGGPGSGPVGVREDLIPFLPNPRIVRTDQGYRFEKSDLSIGRVARYYGNFQVVIRAYVYLKTLGKSHVSDVARYAVLNANYLKESLKKDYLLPIENACKHEVVFSGLADKSTGVTTLDVAKRLLDFGYHPPTIYFPLIIKEALMIEPTEMESLETMDSFVSIMKQIAQEAVSNPELVKTAPHDTPVRRIDEVLAARKPVLRYQDRNNHD
jgi:glycine dehydrogenase subunit 2